MRDDELIDATVTMRKTLKVAYCEGDNAGVGELEPPYKDERHF